MTPTPDNHARETKRRWNDSKPPTPESLRGWNAYVDLFNAIPKGDAAHAECMCEWIMTHVRNGTEPGPEDRRKVEYLYVVGPTAPKPPSLEPEIIAEGDTSMGKAYKLDAEGDTQSCP